MARLVLVDLTGLTFLSSVGIFSLVRAQRRAAERGAVLHAFGPLRRPVDRAFELTGAQEFLHLYPDRDHAITAAA
ncbi:STAS domain-containing protein [Amycolatopsis sp. NPDC059021]|uniref:STAS domain-containing protein n=1 Tax=Amycolatopsis sp. NPDC059021 TaxID=3346704 RepID=UPI00366CE192